MLEHRNSNNNKGISIVELLIAIVVIGVGIAALLSFGTFSLRTTSLQKQTVQASFLVKDVVEALKNYRDNTLWDDDDPGDQYDGLGVAPTAVPLHLELSSDTPLRWQLLLGPETSGIFTKDVVLELVERDISDNIVESGALDLQTKKATVTVSWTERGATQQIETTTYLTNWR
ncbi:MAG: prepilin-type N-terminal cleavage/methylation domain-containing protein [Candidatus Yanofskybacteria bacterium]|nr:prepilin-type N-terminal cleavage/methylation domain-containing protein [Candidatus Yanofskybacteria bacterium]